MLRTMRLLYICWLMFFVCISGIASASDRIFAIVNSIPITEREFADRKKFIIFINKVPAQYHNNPEVNNGVLESLIADNLWVEQGNMYGITVSEDEIKSIIAQVEKNNKLPAGHLIPNIESGGASKETFMAQMKSEVIKNKISRQMIRSVNISESEVERAVIVSQQKPVAVDMKVFTAKFENSTTATSSLKKLSRILSKVKNCDKIKPSIYKNVATVADISATVDKIDDAMSYNVATSLDVGLASEPVKVNGQYKIIMVCKRTVLNMSKNETDYVLNMLGTGKLNAKFRKYYENVRKRASVKVNI